MGKTSTPIDFPYNSNKATHAILWLLRRNNGCMDKLKLIKLLFYVDRDHLNRYGRPVVGGHYWAMDLGPVSGELKDHVDSATSDAGLPFEICGPYNLLAKGFPQEGELSESDIEILNEVYEKYAHIESIKLSRLTHALKVWRKNEPQPGSRKCIPYEDFFLDLDNTQMLKVIRENQQIRSIF